MHNFIKSNNAQPIGPIIQSFALGEDHQFVSSVLNKEDGVTLKRRGLLR